MAQKIDEYKTRLNSALNDNTKPWKAVLDFAEEKTNVPRLYLFAGKQNSCATKWCILFIELWWGPSYKLYYKLLSNTMSDYVCL